MSRSRPFATRSQAIVALILLWLLVGGALAWATRSTVRLSRLERAAEERESFEEARTMALVRLDALLAPLLYKESARPYEHFRSVYKPARALDARDGMPLGLPLVVPSPLRDFPGSDWILLHFQASETHGWTSPQVERRGDWPGLAVTGELPDPVRQAAAATWLEMLASRYTPTSLLNNLERALVVSPSRWIRTLPERGASARAERESARPESYERETSRIEADFARRAARLLQMQRENNPVDRCEPETVALANLETGDPHGHAAMDTNQCVQVSATPMTPLWLDLVPGAPVHLALVRSVTVETSHYCTLQGVLLDWKKLRALLESEVRDLFPQARISPYRGPHPPTIETQLSMMQTIPALMEPGPPAPAAAVAVGAGVGLELSVAWTSTLLALVCITYGSMKYVTLAERRMQFVAAVTHELRTPLTSFQLYGDLLSGMEQEDAEKRRRYADTLCAESRRLSRLVENVLVYSRMDDVRPKLRAREVRPGELMKSAAEATAETCLSANKKIVIQDQCSPDVRVRTDAEFVAQILTNLIENACKYSGRAADPRIWLRTRMAPDGQVVFQVEDAGLGVPARDRKKVFLPFRRSDGEESQAGGLGLGLALSRYWASCLGGKLSLRRASRSGGGLSCFELSIPANNGAIG